MKLACLLLSLVLWSVLARGQNIAELRQVWLGNGTNNERIEAAGELAWEYAFINTDSAEYFANQGLQLITKNDPNAKKQEAYLLGMLGLINDVKGNRKEAIQYYHQSLALKQSLKDSSGIASTYTNIGALFFSQRFYNKALENFRMAAHYEHALKDYSGLTGSFVNIAVIQRNLGQIDSALWYLNSAEQAFVLSGDKQFPASIPANRGSVYLQLGQYEKAAREFDFAIALNKEFGNNRDLCIALENRARVFMYLGQDQDAVRMLEEGMSLLGLVNLPTPCRICMKHVLSWLWLWGKEIWPLLTKIQ